MVVSASQLWVNGKQQNATERERERGVEPQAACMTRQCHSQCLIALHHYLTELQTTHQCQFDSVKVCVQCAPLLPLLSGTRQAFQCVPLTDGAR